MYSSSRLLVFSFSLLLMFTTLTPTIWRHRTAANDRLGCANEEGKDRALSGLTAQITAFSSDFNLISDITDGTFVLEMDDLSSVHR